MSMFRLVPAIDIRDGQCVRLLRGDFARETPYAFDPVELAVRYVALGACDLHVVDLDGAKVGRPVNLELIRRMVGASGARVQVGGGIRDERNLETALSIADRVVIGSMAVGAPERVHAWLEACGPERLVLALDVRLDAAGAPRVTTHGWTEDSGLSLAAALDRYADTGLRHVLCTDVDKDGAMAGPNTRLYARCVARWPEIEWQASGGVRDAADLAQLATTGVAAAIAGRALLDGHLSDEEIRRFSPSA